ncbi:GatB/YqeY domain-containing protein [Candidatus Microgenomates bacterium]|nr:GatB/YqeY domain-containing protein [Candidatus Microgenomates bacterium]
MILSKLREDLNSALKKGESAKVSTLRLLLSALSYEKIAKQHDLSEDEIIAVLKREAKKRQESIELYRQGKREDLANKEEQEQILIRTYLPQDLSEEKIRERVLFLVNHLPQTEKKDFGKAMQAVMTELRGKADGGLISKVVKEVLSKK